MKKLQKKNWFSHRLLFILSLIFVLNFSYKSFAQESFKVVLDAGHGGKDPGNLGNNYVEKDIALKIVLRAGKLLEKDKNIKVIYTRDNDTFIELDERGNIAQREKADLFISVHCDAFTRSEAHGISTFVLGLHENKRNFDIAKRENSVILMEDNYKIRYAGFDPNSPESVIGLTLMQEEFLDQSLTMASLLQKNFINDLNRNDRLVKQAGFLVLRNTFMPSVYIEAGFLTNKNEGKYLNSKEGQEGIAKSIYKAIVEYKKNLDKNMVVEVKLESKIKAEKDRIFKGVDFKVQIASSTKKVPLKSYNFKGLKNVERLMVGKQYKYYYGVTSNYDEILKIQKKVKKAGYPSAFVIAYKKDEKVLVSELLKASQK